MSDFMARSTQPRVLYADQEVPARNTRDMKRGDVVIVNDEYNRYKGELQIVLMDNGKVNVYPLTGDYLKSIPLPEVRYAAILNDSYLASFIYNSSGQMKDRILLFNQPAISKVFPT